MNFRESEPTLSLGGSLLLADPSLKDANFKRVVLFMNQHEMETGAEGVVLNRPMGKVVGELTLSTDAPELNHVPVYIGGPVGTDHLVFASLYWNESKGRLDFEHRLSATDAILRLSEGFEVRAFVGFAGWSAGQLEGELRERAWIPYRPSEAMLKCEADAMWRTTLENMSPWHYLIAQTPEDPSLN